MLPSNKNNKNILILGSNGKIGRKISEEFLQDGHNIIGVDISENKIKKNLSNNFYFILTDLSKEKNIEKIFNKSKKIFNKIDAVINCSYPKSKQFGTQFEKIKENYLKDDLYFQLGIPIMISKVAIKFFINQNYGNLILLSSIQGIAQPKFDHYNNTNMVSPIEYSASKSGIISITKYLAKYYKYKNIRVNCISPGGIENNQPINFKKKYKKSCSNKG